MKKIILLASLTLTTLAISTNIFAHVYIGGALGLGDISQVGFNNLSDINESGFPNDSSTSNSTGLAGRVFAGYQFNNHFALESGFSKFSNFNINSSGHCSCGFPVTATSLIKTYAIDLILKGILPLKHGFNLFATLGGAYTHQYMNVEIQEQASGNSYNQTSSSTQNTFSPTFGLGAGYDINQSLSANLSWSRILSFSVFENLNSIDFFGLGLSYHFS